MKINIDKFDLKDVPVSSDQVFTFPEGLVGFEASKRFALFHDVDNPTVFYLQSLDDSQLSFPVMSPDNFLIDYQIELSEADCTLIDLKDPADALIVVVVYRDTSAIANVNQVAGQGVDAASGQLELSARAPLVLNTRSRLGMQKMLRDIEPSLVVRAR